MATRYKKPRASRGKAETRAARNIRWIEGWCRIPEGKRDLIGKPVVLREWQRAELRKIYDNPAGTRQAILSFPRKNGKTALISFLLLLHLAGPEAVPNSQLYSSAISRDQAATVFKLAAKIVRLNPEFDSSIIIRDTAKELLCPELGTYYAALSAEKSTAHGKSPIFAIHDELGQVKGPVSQLYDAVETGMGAHDAPMSIIISTQAPTDNDLLSRLIDDALVARDPQTVVSVHSAPLEADPFCEETLKACNPAWGDFLNSTEVLRTMRAAQAMPVNEPSYRNLHLNQRVEASSPLFSRTVWRACGSLAKPIEGVPVYGGLDLSETRDLTALVLVGKVDGVWQLHSTFWLPGDAINERSRLDRVSYDLWCKQGFIKAAPGKTVDYDYVAEYLRGIFDRYDVRKIAFDRWNFRYLRPCLLRAGFTEAQLEARFVEFGQGYQSMSPAITVLAAEVLNRRLAHGVHCPYCKSGCEKCENGVTPHPVMEMCAANAVAITDPSGNKKLAKNKSSGRIDGMTALVDAMGALPSPDEPAPQNQVYVF